MKILTKALIISMILIGPACPWSIDPGGKDIEGPDFPDGDADADADSDSDADGPNDPVPGNGGGNHDCDEGSANVKCSKLCTAAWTTCIRSSLVGGLGGCWPDSITEFDNGNCITDFHGCPKSCAVDCIPINRDTGECPPGSSN